MKEPVDHILRPRLPWRDEQPRTECGYDASKVKTITREDYQRRLKDLGQQRTMMLTCLTCTQTARRWKTWDEDPRKAIGREVEWETAWLVDDRGVLLKDELTAIASLIAAHRDEFQQLLTEIQKRREWVEKKQPKRKRVL